MQVPVTWVLKSLPLENNPHRPQRFLGRCHGDTRSSPRGGLDTRRWQWGGIPRAHGSDWTVVLRMGETAWDLGKSACFSFKGRPQKKALRCHVWEETQVNPAVTEDGGDGAARPQRGWRRPSPWAWGSTQPSFLWVSAYLPTEDVIQDLSHNHYRYPFKFNLIGWSIIFWRIIV